MERDPCSDICSAMSTAVRDQSPVRTAKDFSNAEVSSRTGSEHLSIAAARASSSRLCILVVSAPCKYLQNCHKLFPVQNNSAGSGLHYSVTQQSRLNMPKSKSSAMGPLDRDWNIVLEMHGPRFKLFT